MIEIEGKIVSTDLFRENFMCDLGQCKGICCVEGNAGAPLEDEEVEVLKEEYQAYKPYMKASGVEAIESSGFMVIDIDGDPTTPLIEGEECAYSFGENGVTLCAVERAWKEGKTEFRKPISCHLYPIRIVKFERGGCGLNYHRWNVCSSAVECGNRLKMPVFRALKEPIERGFGEEFYEAMDETYRYLKETEQL